MAKSAAVYLLPDRFAALVLDGTAKRWRIAAADAGALPEPEGEKREADAAASAALGAALKKIGAPHDPVVLAVASTGAVFRNMQLPFTGDDAIEKVLKFECESHLHQYNIDDVVLDFVTVEEQKGATDLLAVAAPKRALRAQIDLLDRVNYDPAIVDLDALALFNAVAAAQAVPVGASVLVLHVGREETLALVIEEAKLKTVRSIRLAVGPRREAALPAGEAKGPFDAKDTDGAAAALPAGDAAQAAESAAERAAAPEADERIVDLAEGGSALPALVTEERRAEILSKLAREATRTIAAGVRRGPDEILVCGEGAAIPGLVEAIGEALAIPSRELDLFEGIEGAPADPDLRRRLPIALGAALKPLGVDHTGSDFRQEDLRFSKKLETLKVPLAALSASIAFALLLWNIYIFREFQGQQNNAESHAIAGERTLREVPPGLQTLQKKMTSVVKRFETDPPLDRLRLYSTKLDEEIKSLKDLYGAGGASFSKPQSAWEATQRFFSFLKKNEEDIGSFVVDRYIAQTDTNNPTSSKVTVKATLTFLGDGADATTRCGLLRRRLKEQRWCEDSREGTVTPNDAGVAYEGFTVIVDLAKESSN